MTGSSFTGERTVSLSHFTRSFLRVLRSRTSSLTQYSFISALLLKGGPRFPRADGRQNGHGFRRRVFLWGYVCDARFIYLRVYELVDDNRTVRR